MEEKTVFYKGIVRQFGSCYVAVPDYDTERKAVLGAKELAVESAYPIVEVRKYEIKPEKSTVVGIDTPNDTGERVYRDTSRVVKGFDELLRNLPATLKNSEAESTLTGYVISALKDDAFPSYGGVDTRKLASAINLLTDAEVNDILKAHGADEEYVCAGGKILEGEAKELYEAYCNSSCESTADVLAELLTDDSISAYNVLEPLCEEYLAGDEEFRRGVDTALTRLVHHDLCEIAKLAAELERDKAVNRAEMERE